MASLGGGDAAEFKTAIENSFTAETAAFLSALRGDYVNPGKGNDPVRTPEALPTGRNFYALDASVMPTKISYELAKQLVKDALAKHDKPPEKVGAVLWAVETTRDEGTMLSFILQLLGVEPVWDARGLEPLAMNAVARQWIGAAQAALKRGDAADLAGERALLRIFGPAEGAYGAGISRIVEQAWTWKSREQVADAYLGKMAHAYSGKSWGTIDPEEYRTALTGIQE